MYSLFKYIIFLTLSFNISNAFGAEITFEPLEDEQIETQPNFIEASNLPHPIQMREIINSPETSAAGTLLTLGRYFDERYQGNALNTNFSEDVALIFPQLSAQEVATATKYIRMAIIAYRYAKEKITQIQEQSIAPKDPPLVVSDDEYAIIGDREYIETPQNQVAIISDFKKIVNYSHNKREVEAMEAFFLRLNEKNGEQTDLEKFRQMLSKIEFSKIPSYGITLPSPFVGNAGIGKWVEEDNIRARLISDTARFSTTQEITIGLHLDIPNHKMILATSLNDEQKKPLITLKNVKNIDSYEIFYPLPVQVTYHQMLGAYRGNFAFPIRIKPIDWKQPISFEAEITFQSCDGELACTKQTLTPTLTISSDSSGSNTPSSMSNFIHQSLYNIPKEQNKFLRLNDFSFTTDPQTNKIATLNFDFDTRRKPQNIALFLENEQNTVFSAPKIIVTPNHVYIQTTPLENTSHFLEKPLTLTARINDYAVLRKELTLQNFTRENSKYNFSTIYITLFIIGLLFYITPFGFALTRIPLSSKQKHDAIRYLSTKTLCMTIIAILITILLRHHTSLFYFSAQNNIFYLSAALIVLSIRLLTFRIQFPQSKQWPAIKGFIDALQVALFVPLAFVSTSQATLFKLQTLTLPQIFLAFVFLILGLQLPILNLIYHHKKIHPNFKQLYHLTSVLMTIIAWIITALWLSFQITLPSLFKAAIILIVALLCLKYILYFWETLYKTKLPASSISITEKILVILLLVLAAFFAFTIGKTCITKDSTPIPSLDKIQQRALSGENILLAIQNPSCLICKYNIINVFNKSTINKLQDIYKITYINVSQKTLTPETVTYLTKYKKTNLPLYVLYTLYTPQGIVLPTFLTLSDLTQTFQTAKIYPSSSPSMEELLAKRRKTLFR